MTHVAAVIFDMDGVLCDSEPFICEAACRMFQERHHTTVTPPDFLPFVGAGEDRFLGGVAEKYGIHLSMPSDKERTYAIYLQIIQGRLHPLPGAVDFISHLQKAGLKLAIATSADRVKLDGNLKQIGLPPSTFNAIVTGSEITLKKPHPEIFTTAAEKLSLPNSRCLVIEDAVNGIKAGRAAGSPCLGITTSFDSSTLRDVGAHWTAPDLAHVPADLLSFLRLP